MAPSLRYNWSASGQGCTSQHRGRRTTERHAALPKRWITFLRQKPRRFFVEAYITYLLAGRTDKVHILDGKDFDGGIPADIEKALRFVEFYTRTACRIECYRCKNGPAHRTYAQREAFTNDFMSCDLLVEGAKVFDEVYPDIVEVVSLGSLPRGFSLAAHARMSIRRNALVADSLHPIDFIEKAGTGSWRVLNKTRAQVCSAPDFEVNGFFTATFWPNRDMQERAEGRFVEPVTGERRPLRAMAGEKTRQKSQKALVLEYRDHFRNAHLLPAIQTALFEVTIPDRTGSSNQRYRLKPKGRQFLSLPEELL